MNQILKTKFFLLVAIITIFIVGCFKNAGRWLVKEDEKVHGDAIVVLMGSINDRILQVSDLYMQGYADKVLMVETVPPEKLSLLTERGGYIRSNTVQSRKALIRMGIPEKNIIKLEGGASSTQTEAIIIREYLMTTSDIDTIILVSSSEHTRRASMIFGTAFKYYNMPVSILCSPSKYTNFNDNRWWRHKNDFERVFFEYLKIGNFILFEKRQLRN